MDRRLSWTSSVCLAHLLGGGLALLLAAGRALLLHDRVVDRGALLLVHAVALLLVHSLALTVLQISLKIDAKLDKSLGFLSLAKLLTCSCVQICSWTVVHCGSLVVEHFCSFTVSHFCRDGNPRSGEYLQASIFSLRPVRWRSQWRCRTSSPTPVGTVARTSCCTYGPARSGTAACTRQRHYETTTFFLHHVIILSRKLQGCSNYYCIFVTARSVRFNLSLVVVAAIFKSLPLSCRVINQISDSS